jgi:hypothetical protein
MTTELIGYDYVLKGKGYKLVDEVQVAIDLFTGRQL